MHTARGNEAIRLFREEGYNCAQAVALAFLPELGLEKAQAARLIAGFGGGMSRLREVCGTVSGCVFVLGSLYAAEDPKDYEAKKDLYHAVQELAAAFAEKNGSIVCRTLLKGASVQAGPDPERRDSAAYAKRPCFDYAATAADLLDAFIKVHPDGLRARKTDDPAE